MSAGKLDESRKHKNAEKESLDTKKNYIDLYTISIAWTCIIHF